MSFKIDKISLQNGAAFSPGELTVIVGPNNSGKTRLLKEINLFLSHKESDLQILSTITSSPADLDAIVDSLGLKHSTTPDGNTSFTSSSDYFGAINQNGTKQFFDTLREDLKRMGPTESVIFRDCFGRGLSALVTTEDRLTAAKAGLYNEDKKTLLSAFYDKGSDCENQVSSYVEDVFDINIKLDYTKPGRLAIRVGGNFSDIPSDPRDAQQPLKEYTLLEDHGDGIRSFTTCVLLILLTKRPYILLDEPDAFLHPPQAAELGRIVANLANKHQSIILSTHNYDLLRGIISERTDVNILRLTRNESGTSAHVLESSEVQTITRNPILSSSRVLEGIFYQGVVITEGDSDRAFYERIARKYFPSEEVHYTHAQSKQAVHKLIEPYKRLNVNVTAILDFDILRTSQDLKRTVQSTGKTNDLVEILRLQGEIQTEINSSKWTDKYGGALKAIKSRQAEELKKVEIEKVVDSEGEAGERLRLLESDFKKIFDEADKWSLAKNIGRECLSEPSKSRFDQLNRLCKAAGIFIVPCGSLESWLLKEGIPPSSNKAKWITSALEWLEGNTPDSMDATNFIESIHEQLT